jgi:hypothetical protein
MARFARTVLLLSVCTLAAVENINIRHRASEAGAAEAAADAAAEAGAAEATEVRPQGGRPDVGRPLFA